MRSCRRWSNVRCVAEVLLALDVLGVLERLGPRSYFGAHHPSFWLG
jgi:hypothetical protein